MKRTAVTRGCRYMDQSANHRGKCGRSALWLRFLYLHTQPGLSVDSRGPRHFLSSFSNPNLPYMIVNAVTFDAAISNKMSECMFSVKQSVFAGVCRCFWWTAVKDGFFGRDDLFTHVLCVVTVKSYDRFASKIHIIKKVHLRQHGTKLEWHSENIKCKGFKMICAGWKVLSSGRILSTILSHFIPSWSSEKIYIN